MNKNMLSHLLERLLGFPGVSVVKNLPAMKENWVGSLGQEGPLEKEIIPWTEEPSGPWSMGLKESDMIKHE